MYLENCMQIPSVVFALSLQIKQAKGMRKQLISFVQVINFFVKYQAQGFFNPNPPPLAYALEKNHGRSPNKKIQSKII